MTKLFNLFNQMFGNQAEHTDLEHYINSYKPTTHQQIEDLTRCYYSKQRDYKNWRDKYQVFFSHQQ